MVVKRNEIESLIRNRDTYKFIADRATVNPDATIAEKGGTEN
jgi:hypothetical protein